MVLRGALSGEQSRLPVPAAAGRQGNEAPRLGALIKTLESSVRFGFDLEARRHPSPRGCGPREH